MAGAHPDSPPVVRRSAAGWLAAAVACYLVLEVTTATVRFAHRPDDASQVTAASWLAYTEHHLVQLGAALGLVLLISRGRLAGFGFTLAHREESWRLLTRGFFPVLLVSLLVGHVVVPLWQGSPPARFAESLPAPGDLVGMLLFGLVLVGLSEEVAFRGLLHTVLARGWHGTVRVAGVDVPVAGFWSAGLFTLAHVGLSVAPLGVTSVDPRQLLLAWILGLYYAVALHRTGSLLAPVLAHNAVNGGILLAELAVTAALLG